jgi:SUKH-4 immunity protein
MAINAEEIRHAVEERLPRRARWIVPGVETIIDWYFSRASQPLQPLTADDAVRWAEALPEDWRELLIFGEEDVGEGGGARPLLCVHGQTGEVFGLDIERPEAARYFLNSSMAAFVDTFLVFDRALTGGQQTVSLTQAVRAADPDVFERSDWRSLADYVLTQSDGA